jgi:hypothetical protein
MRPKRFGQRPTRKEFAARIRFMKKLLAENLRKGEIKKRFRVKFGPLAARTIERYATRAGADLSAIRLTATTEAKEKNRQRSQIKKLTMLDRIQTFAPLIQRPTK